MLVLGVDFETTGLNVAEDHITEVGAMLWDTERNTPVNPILSSYCTVPVKLDPKITELTGITDQDLETHGYAPKKVLDALVQLMNKADAIMAHNGNLFDKPILEANAARHQVALPAKLWIDSSTDIEFPPEITTRRLKHLAAEHGFLNPFAHRAIFDVSTMLQVASRYEWDQMIRFAKAPTLTVRADTTYQQRELAKKANYRWNGERKEWLKSIKDFQLEDERAAAKAAGFAVSVLKGV